MSDQQQDSAEQFPIPQDNQQSQTYTFTFTGNSHFSEKDLLKTAAVELQMFEQRGFRKADIDDGAFQMRSAYLQAGFAFAFVDYYYEKKANLVNVTFMVEEGPQVFIEKINFEGNGDIGSDTLLGFFLQTSGSLRGSYCQTRRRYGAAAAIRRRRTVTDAQRVLDRYDG